MPFSIGLFLTGNILEKRRYNIPFVIIEYILIIIIVIIIFVAEANVEDIQVFLLVHTALHVLMTLYCFTSAD